ncbi:hypothetical protein [Streptomyces sp. B3I7]|uniref:hypothetical protein n=1 Tax=Streptomyces sp. B3I7 TaxID=3042269 RepID=UPI00358DE5DB
MPGGGTLTDFAPALLIGIVVGTYSSVFTATPPAVLRRDALGAGRRTRERARCPDAGPGHGCLAGVPDTLTWGGRCIPYRPLHPLNSWARKVISLLYLLTAGAPESTLSAR